MGYSSLGNAIVIQAVEDYEQALYSFAGAKSDFAREHLSKEIKELRNFFDSKWYGVLSNGVESSYLLEKVETRFWSKIFGFENHWSKSKVLSRHNKEARKTTKRD